MDLNDIAVFAKVVQAGSFTKAAQLLKAPKSTVSAKVAALERRLGVTLLQRTTRKLSVTTEGDAFFRACVAALGELEAAEALVSAGQKTPHGQITVTAPVSIGERFMPLFLKRFLAQYPAIKVNLILTNRFVDLVGEGVDLAIRAGSLNDSSLMAKKIGTSRRSLFAAPAYMKQVHEIRHPHDLKGLACLRWSKESLDEWYLMSAGKTVRVKVDGRITTDDLSALKELAIHGLGIALLPTFFAHEDVVRGRLVALLPEWCTESNSVAIVYPAQRFQHVKVRIFIDELAKALKNDFFSVNAENEI